MEWEHPDQSSDRLEWEQREQPSVRGWLLEWEHPDQSLVRSELLEWELPEQWGRAREEESAPMELLGHSEPTVE